MTEIYGLITPVCTPFSPDDKSIDENALKRLIDYQIDSGTHCIMSCGGTGEFYHLDVDEQKRVTEVVIEHVNKRAAVMAHTGATSTRQVVELSKHAEAAGADALMIVPPFYELPSDDEVVRHYEIVSEAVSLPIMLYNSGSCRVDFGVGLLERLAEIDNITMVKDACSGLIDFQDILKNCPDSIAVFTGADTLAFSAMSLGGVKGWVSGGANCTPKQCVKLYELIVEQDDIPTARKLWQLLYPLNQFFETQGYVASVKAATKLAGVDVGVPRDPFQELSGEKVRQLRKLMEPLGVIGTAK